MAKDPLPDIEARHRHREAALAAFRRAREEQEAHPEAVDRTVLDQFVCSIERMQDDISELLAENRLMRTAIYQTQQLVVQLTARAGECSECHGSAVSDCGDCEPEPCPSCNDITFIRDTLELCLQDVPEFDE